MTKETPQPSMARFSSLRARFGLWCAGMLLVALVIFSALVYFLTAHSLYAGVDETLEVSADQAIATAKIEQGRLAVKDFLPSTSKLTELSDEGVTIRLLAATGETLEAAGPYRLLPVNMADLDAARHGEAIFATLTVPQSGTPTRWLTVPFADGEHLIGAVQVAQSLDDVEQALQRLLTILLLSIPLLIGMALFGGYWLATSALSPIDQITRAAQQISANDLHARLNLSPTDDEVGRLAATFDGMLARLDDAFRRERQFTADASHELRTPLAAMEAILSVTRERSRTNAEYEEALDDLTETTQWMHGLVERLLLLARTDITPKSTTFAVDMTNLLRDVVDSLQPQVEAKGLTLTALIPEGLQIMGDSDDLVRLFINLLGNAVKYTEQGEITLCADLIGNNLRVSIRDTGIGIAQNHLPHLFDRFFRADAARGHDGIGLGLAIAQAITRAHGGTISAESVLGEGSIFVVTLPNASSLRSDMPLTQSENAPVPSPASFI